MRQVPVLRKPRSQTKYVTGLISMITPSGWIAQVLKPCPQWARNYRRHQIPRHRNPHVWSLNRGYTAGYGTHESFTKHRLLSRPLEQRQGVKFAQLEEIAYRQGCVDLNIAGSFNSASEKAKLWSLARNTQWWFNPLLMLIAVGLPCQSAKVKVKCFSKLLSKLDTLHTIINSRNWHAARCNYMVQGLSGSQTI